MWLIILANLNNNYDGQTPKNPENAHSGPLRSLIRAHFAIYDFKFGFLAEKYMFGESSNPK